MTMRAAWERALVDLGARPAWEPFDDLLRRYAEPHRRYHTVTHLADVVIGVTDMAELCDDVAATVVAAFFHDAVYEIGGPGNEAASAVLASEQLARLGADRHRTDRVAALVLCTADHRPPPDRELRNDAAVLIDADLAVLARPAGDYERYVTAVREEYGAVPDDAWRSGRAAVLESLLRRERIYVTDAGAALERAARRNLRRELNALGAGAV